MLALVLALALPRARRRSPAERSDHSPSADVPRMA
jgi:hypothetical protein